MPSSPKPPRRKYFKAATQQVPAATAGANEPMSIADIVAARPTLWTVPELAELLSVSSQFLYDLVKDNRIPSICAAMSCIAQKSGIRLTLIPHREPWRTQVHGKRQGKPSCRAG